MLELVGLEEGEAKMQTSSKACFGMAFVFADTSRPIRHVPSHEAKTHDLQVRAAPFK